MKLPRESLVRKCEEDAERECMDRFYSIPVHRKRNFSVSKCPRRCLCPLVFQQRAGWTSERISRWRQQIFFIGYSRDVGLFRERRATVRAVGKQEGALWQCSGRDGCWGKRENCWGNCRGKVMYKITFKYTQHLNIPSRTVLQIWNMQHQLVQQNVR